MEKKDPSTIKEYFEGQSILITGSTGTLGKILVEKILRCCPGVTRLYLLIREKKQKSIEERWNQITELPLFDVLKKSNPEALDKVALIPGDITSDDLGLSDEHKQHLIENVTMIYHMAAMVQFTDSMTSALISNTKATYTLLNFARNVKNLQLFLYVSTAFCNMNIPCDKAIEEVIPATIDWRVVLKLLETEPMALDFLKEKLLSGHPNPYTWSKCLAEQIVNDYRIYFPTVITRPAAVGGTVRDPFPSWLDTIDGINALTYIVGIGALRVVYTTWDSYQDYIPADAAINAIIVATWKKHKEPSPELTDVYNCCYFKELPLKIIDYYNWMPVLEKYPSRHIMWAPHFIFTTNDLLYKVLFLLLQLIPAAFVDLLNLIRWKKTWAMKMTTKVANIFRIFKKFSAAQIAFPNDKFKELNNIIPKEEWDTFNTVYNNYTIQDFITLGYDGIKKYYHKEPTDEESMAKNRKRLFWLKIADEVLVFSLWMVGIFLLSKFIISRFPWD